MTANAVIINTAIQYGKTNRAVTQAKASPPLLIKHIYAVL